MNISNLYQIFTSSSSHNSLIKDEFDRTPYYTYRHGDIFSPQVSDFIADTGFSPLYPDGKKFAVCLSHDIDILLSKVTQRPSYEGGFRNIISLAGYELLERLKRNPVQKIELNDDWNVMRTIEKENKIGAVSTFYFLSANPKDIDYNYHPELVKDQFRMILDAGSEIGLHGSHQAYLSSQKMSEEKIKLESSVGRIIEGYRNHYLRFSIPDTWNNLSLAGFKYDSTYGYPDCAGFRNGMCYPHQPYDLNKKKFINIIELPLIIMDGTLFQYMRLTFAEAWKIVEHVINKISSINGVFTILWHNNRMQGEWGDFYQKFLTYIQHKDAWITTSENLVNWYLTKGYINQITSIIQQEIIQKYEH